MYILAFILLFVIGSVQAACHGDWSGIEAGAKFIGIIALFCVMAFIMINPALMIIVAVIVVIGMIACCGK